MNSDVAAFASRAKVVYPINQKYRVSLSQKNIWSSCFMCLLLCSNTAKLDTEIALKLWLQPFALSVSL